MKTLALFLFFILSFSVTAQIVNIPDPIFKARLIVEGVDTNHDGEIQVSEAEAVTGMLDVSIHFPEPIYDLTGIEAFINITGLSVQGNQLTTLNLSNNTLLIELDCISNNLTYLNVENCINLEKLWAYHNQLTSIDLSQNINLKVLSLYNNQLTGIDLTSNNLLEKVYVSDNQLTFLNLTQNSELIEFTCDNNLLNYLDIRNNNNNHLSYFYSINNPDLTCIFVDDAEYSESAPDWYKDPTSTYVETQAECDALGIEDINDTNIRVYPNPVIDMLHLNFPDNHNYIELSILDIRGLYILNYKLHNLNNPLNLSELKSGVYFLIVKDNLNKMITTKKLIKL